MQVSLETVKRVSDVYNEGIKNLKSIATITNLAVPTVCRALNEGKKQGLCNYIPRKCGVTQIDEKSYKKKVKCTTNNYIYDSIGDAFLETGCTRKQVSLCCQGRINEVISRDGKIYKFEFI